MSNNNSSPRQSNSNDKGNSEPVSPISPRTDAKKQDDAAADGRRGAVSGPASNHGTTNHQEAEAEAQVVPASQGGTNGRRNAIAVVLDGTEGSLNQGSPAGKK